MIPGLRRLICVCHFMKRDESKLADLLLKIARNIADRKLSSSKIIKNISGSRVANFHEYGIVEAIDPDDFNAKLDSLEDRWEAHWPGFHQWLVGNSFCSSKASSNLQGSIRILRAFIIKVI